MHQSIPAAPSHPHPPPRANAQEFFSYGWQIPRRRGHSSWQMPGDGDERRGQMPRPKTILNLWPDVKCANVFQHRRF